MQYCNISNAYQVVYSNIQMCDVCVSVGCPNYPQKWAKTDKDPFRDIQDIFKDKTNLINNHDS